MSIRRRIHLASKPSDGIPDRPVASHRHAMPSGPWPWLDLESEVDAVQLACPHPPIPAFCDHKECGGCWIGYPQSRFPNWTPDQVERSGINNAITKYNKNVPCVIYHVDVDTGGFFTDAGARPVDELNKGELWHDLITGIRPSNIRVRALFLEHLSGPVLQILGTKYNIEPFFWSSSLSWIPSRFQEEVHPKKGDHITITMTFLRPMDDPTTANASLNSGYDSSPSTVTFKRDPSLAEQVIDTQAPLHLRSSGRLLVLDLLAVHLIRNTDGNTIISYHPHPDMNTTTAPHLHTRIRFAGQSVYWQSIFQKSPDPTFVLLTFIWHAMYAWDESLETLYAHICWLETRVINTSDWLLTQELHVIRAHHLHYSALLEDFRKSVMFILNTPNPAMDSLPHEEREWSRDLLKKECDNLLSEINRLEKGRIMQDRRLKNVMNLVFSSVNIGDSKRMQRLTEAAVRDSAAMKQIAYLTMIFLPASFVAAVFGMNIHEIVPGTNGSLPHYFETAIPLTIATIWIVVAFQSKHFFRDRNATFLTRLGWPAILLREILGRRQLDAEEMDLGLQTYRAREAARG